MKRYYRYKCGWCNNIAYRITQDSKRPCCKCGLVIDRSDSDRKVKAFTKSEDQFLKENHKKYGHKTLAKMMGRAKCSVAGRLRILKLKLPEDVRLERKKIGMFKKGQVAWNKGLSLPKVPNSGQYKKGNVPYSTLCDGAITIRRDHPKRKWARAYKWIRISKGKWKMLHVDNWEKVNGPVLKGHIIVFKDYNTMNTEINNLMKITLKENMDRNRNYDYDRYASDKLIAFWMTRQNPELKEEVLKHPELIEAKRQQLKLNRVLNENRRSTKSNGEQNLDVQCQASQTA